ncbi:MAG TPA: flagellar basal body M-ring protein FliF [Gammaproteobacteria bacterium]|nr:flagellar basal body M-ring protein FliF [Gammaproteobacteria bacterium]
MAENKPGSLVAFQGLNKLTILRQIGLMVGLAASVAIGVAVVLWSQAPNYQQLYNGLSETDMVSVTAALQSSGVDFKMVHGSGTVLVPADQVQKLKLSMASQGLPAGKATGFEILDQEQSFGTSQFIEKVRYQRALEGELAKTISSMRNVQSARVHLALPKQSVFVRNRKPPTASVFVNLVSGRSLSEDQVAAIAHLVASSVPDLTNGNVSITDHKGRLLSAKKRSMGMEMNSEQFEYKHRLENYYIKRIEEIISPMVGIEGVRAQVTADLDFTVSELTEERFEPDQMAIRSEQITERRTQGANGIGGVPGALTNQPPEEAVLVDGEAGVVGAGGEAKNSTSNSSRRAVRNYELNKKISHIRNPTGTVQRLSVAVLVNERSSTNEEGVVESQPLTENEIANITTLVKETIGFDEARGDRVSVVNASFYVPEVGVVPEAGLMDNPMLITFSKQFLGWLMVLILIFAVLRPVLRSLAEKGAAAPPVADVAALPDGSNDGGAVGQLENRSVAVQEEPSPNALDNRMVAAKAIVDQDPKRVAQVVKEWISE